MRDQTRRQYLALCTFLAATALGPGITAQTVDPALQVWIWALVPDPVDLTAGSDGALYAGRDLTGSGGTADEPTRIHRISATAVVAAFGPSLDDPDTVWFDGAGVVTPSPGSILVGGRDNGITPLQARVSAVAPDETATLVFGPSTLLVNPAGMTVDSLGRLLITDFDMGNLVVLVGSSLVTLVDGPARGVIDVVVHPVTGDMYASWGDNVIRRYTSAGVLLDGSFGTGRALEFGPGNATFGSDLYTVDNAAHTLKRIDPAKNVTTLGTGFQDVWGLTFGTDGALYLTEFSKDRVLRVSCLPAVSETSNLQLAKQDAGATLQFTWDDEPGASDYVVFQNSSPSTTFISQTGSSATGLLGLSVPMPAGNAMFFLVGARDDCGVGPLNGT